MIRPHLRLLAAAGLLALIQAGCAQDGVDTAYGRSIGPSINGTSALAELLKANGREVRAAVRLNEVTGSWADVLVRFAPAPGPPELIEANALHEWLRAEPGRKVVYVARDYDAEPEFWAAVLEALPKETTAEARGRVEARRNASRNWAAALPKRPAQVARADRWFATIPPSGPPAAARTLSGPWAEGVDAGKAAIVRHEVLRVEEGEPVLLSGDDAPLVASWTLDNGSAVLAIANGSFLLNAALLDRARRPLAARVVEWIGPGPGHVAFLEGGSPTKADPPKPASQFALLWVEPFGWVGAHLGAFGLLFCLALAATLGRPRAEPATEAERPSAHPEALGSLLARTGRADVALGLLESYRRWRHPAPAGPGRAGPNPTPPPSPRRVPRA